MFRLVIPIRTPTPNFSASGRRGFASATKDVPFFAVHGASMAAKKEQPVRLMMLAKPGSGKGTLSSKLINKYDIKFLSTGDILRQHIKDKTDIGRKAEAIVAQGGLLSDELMIKLLSTNLEALRGKSWILDGFPRTIGQGELLDQHLATTSSPLSLIVHLDVPDEVILSRIADRWIHPSSGRVYNSSYNRPIMAGLDDVTGEPLVRRPDDNPDVFAKRLSAYYESTAPLLAYYQSRAASRLVTLTGRTSDEIWPQLDAIVQSRFRLSPKTPTKNIVPEEVIQQTERDVGRRISRSDSERVPMDDLLVPIIPIPI